MTDDEIIERFETGTVQCDEFHHIDHVRLAFAYLSQYPALLALDRFTGALRHFADSCGKPQLYHETITHAYFFLIRDRMARTTPQNWEDFAASNMDLLQWKGGVLSRYYDEATLESDLAREVFLFPDKTR